ncbi:MAG: HTTM domain-containing protein [Flammeovirgaceae bacterium]|nr:HTTM domain-containing protein [Flammeovirgaceae bacterium]
MLINTSYFSKTTSSAPLAVFRVAFGLLMFISMIRFWALGWIDKLYIQPSFFFSYYGFEWIKPLGGLTYFLFFICGLSALCVAVGLRYKWAIITFFLSFTYIELMDKTTYLNHYYFVSVISFLLIFLPAGNYFAWDSLRGSRKLLPQIPQWNIDVIKLLLCIVYLYAGLAKLNSEWLLQGMPLKIWLPTKDDLPMIGFLFRYNWMIYLFAWGGALYDLIIPFLLLNRKTRGLGFTMVVFFHLLTAILFPIGMFPYLMIFSALIFFNFQFHKKTIDGLRQILNIKNRKIHLIQDTSFRHSLINRVKIGILVLFFLIQIGLPFRHMLYPGNLFWTEEGYRWSWRVMLMEKAGNAQFKIVDNASGSWFYVNNEDFLTSFQEKQMATQPDFILQYAHFLNKHFSKQDTRDFSIFVDCFVALNGRKSTRFIDPEFDLTKGYESFAHKSWILPFNE